MSDASNPRHLLLDFDCYRDKRGRVDGPSLATLHLRLRILGIEVAAIRYKRSNSKGWHVLIVLVHPLRPAEIVACQCVLGSDLQREQLNLMRVLHMKNADAHFRHRWNILFGRKLT